MQIKIKHIAMAASLGLVVAITGLTGCKNNDRTYGEGADDHRVASHVREALDKEPVYKFPEVHVTSYDRVVQLSGRVQSDDQRTRAGQVAGSVEGVKEVINNILVNEFPATGRSSAPIRMGQP